MPDETISVTVTGEQLRAVRESVAAGEYASAGDVLQDAVLLWQQRRQNEVVRLEAARDRIRRSIDDPRPDLSSEDVQASLDALFAQAGEDARRA